jgi:hypothetical protein
MALTYVDMWEIIRILEEIQKVQLILNTICGSRALFNGEQLSGCGTDGHNEQYIQNDYKATVYDMHLVLLTSTINPLAKSGNAFKSKWRYVKI